MSKCDPLHSQQVLVRNYNIQDSIVKLWHMYVCLCDRREIVLWLIHVCL